MMTARSLSIGLVSAAVVAGATAVLLGALSVHAQAPGVAMGELAATQRFDMTATVEAVDNSERTVTVKGEDGTRSTLDVPREVRNFDQIEVGDRVRATYIDAVVMAIRKPGAPISASEAKVVRMAPAGDKPGSTEIRTRDLTVTVTAIDAGRRLVTLRGPQGNSRTIHLDAGVDLRGVKVGDDVEVRHTEATVLAVEKAQR